MSCKPINTTFLDEDQYLLKKPPVQMFRRIVIFAIEHGMNCWSTIVDETFCNTLVDCGLFCEYRFDFSAKCKFLPQVVVALRGLIHSFLFVNQRQPNKRKVE